MEKFKSYIYLIVAGLIITGGLIFTLYFGLEPKTVQKIKLSEFKTMEAFTKAVHMRMWQDLRDAKILFLGVEPGSREHLQFWYHFISNPYEGDIRFDEMYIEPGLKYGGELKNFKPLDIKMEHESLVKAFIANKNSDRRVVFIVPQVYAAQVIKDNPVNRLIKESGVSVLSLSLTVLPRSEDDFKLTTLPCAAEGADYTGQSPLGCIVRRKYVGLKKAKLTSEKILGLVDQVGLNDYLVMMSTSNSLNAH